MLAPAFGIAGASEPGSPERTEASVEFAASENALVRINSESAIAHIEYHWNDRVHVIPPGEISDLGAVNLDSVEIVGGEDSTLEPYRFIRIAAGPEQCAKDSRECSNEIRFFFRWPGYESRWIWAKTANRLTTIYRKDLGKDELPGGRKPVE